MDQAIFFPLIIFYYQHMLHSKHKLTSQAWTNKLFFINLDIIVTIFNIIITSDLIICLIKSVKIFHHS